MPVLSYRKSSSIGDISEVDIQNYSIFFFGNPASLELPYWKSTVLQEYFTGNPTRAFDIELGFQLLQIIPAVYPVHSALFEPNVQRPSIVFNWLSVFYCAISNWIFESPKDFYWRYSCPPPSRHRYYIE